jgi:carbon monoxide dehydrogenase subunit G
MEFDSTFEVASPVDEVWAAILDLERSAPCLPGARVVERTGQHEYRIAMRARVGSTPTTFAGRLQVLDQDPEKHVATIQVHAEDPRHPGTANANVVLRLADRGGATHGTIFTQMALSGRAGSVGSDTVIEAAARSVEQFARCLAERLGSPESEVRAEVAPPATEPRPVAVPDPAPAPVPARDPAREVDEPAVAEGRPDGAEGTESEPGEAEAAPEPAEAVAEAGPAPAPPPPADVTPGPVPAARSLASRLADPRALGLVLVVLAVVLALARRLASQR